MSWGAGEGAACKDTWVSFLHQDDRLSLGIDSLMVGQTLGIL